MSLTETAGDLFEPVRPAIGHGCNCRGVMGAGVAGEMAARFPLMRVAYQRACAAGSFRPGDIFPWDAADGVRVYNLATQVRPGPDARLDAIRVSVARMLGDAGDRGIPAVAIPRIGCGIGGLRWDDVRQVLAEVAACHEAVLEVVTPPVQGTA